MDDLIAFLRARLDEQQERAQGWADYDGDAFYVNDAGRELLAEVAAKRAIIEMHRGDHECPSENSSCGWWIGGCPTLHLLALSYADHASYRSEWKP